MADLTLTILGVDALSGPARAAAGSLSGIESAAGRVGGALTSVAATAAKAALAIGAIAGTAFVAGMTSAVTVAASFEQQLSAIAAVSSKAEVATVGGMKAISDAALELGKSTSFSATEAAAGMEEMVKAGVSLTDVIGGGAKAALDLAAAGALSVSEAATVASNAMNAFALSGKDLPGIADTLANAASASATDVHQLGLGLAAVGAVAHTVGLSFEDTTTAIAAFAQAGLRGSDAGTSFKTLLLSLTPSTKGATQQMKDLGIITAEGANQFFTAEGKVKDFASIAGVLQNAMKGLTKEQQINALQTMFGTDAIRAAAIMAEIGAEGANKLTEAQKDVGGAAAVAKERLNNLKGAMEALGGSWEVIRIKIGTPFLPILTKAAQALTKALNDAEPAITKWAEKLAAGFDGLITRAQKAVPGLLLVGGAVLTFGRQLTDLARGALPMVTGAFETLTEFFTSGEAASGLTSFAEQARSGFATLTPVVTAVGQAVVTNVIDTFKFLQISVLPPVLSILQQTADLFMGTLLPAAQQTGAVMRGILGETLSWLANTVMPPFLSIVQQTSEWFTTVMLPTLPAVATALRTTLGDTIQWLSTTVWPMLTSAATVAWGYISGTIIPALPGFAAMIRQGLGTALEWVASTGWPLLVKGATVAWSFLTDKVVPALTSLVSWLKEKVPPAIESLTAAWEAVRSRVQPIVEALFNGDIKDAISKAGAAFSEFGTLAMGWLGEQVALIDWAEVWNKTSDVLASAATWFADAAARFAGWLGEQVGKIDWVNVWNKATQVVEATAMWFADAGSKFATWIGQQVAAIDWGAVWANAKDVILGTAQWFVPIVVDWAKWIGEKVAGIDWASVWAQAKDVVLGMAQWFVTVATDFATWIGDQVAKIDWASVWSGITGMSAAMQTAFEIEAAKLDWKAITASNKDMARQMAEALNEQIAAADWTTVGATFADKLFGGGGGTGIIEQAMREGWKVLRAPLVIIEPLVEFITTADWHAADVALAQAFTAFLQRAWDTATGGWKPRLPVPSDWWGPTPPGTGAVPGASGTPVPMPGSGGSNAPAGGGNVMSYPSGGWEDKAYKAAQKAGHPNPVEFVEQMRWESGGFDPNVINGNRNSSAGAQGIAQIMPQYHPGVNPLDPDAALEYAANLMTQNYATYGNTDEALAAYNGGQGAVNQLRAGTPYGETRQYLSEVKGATASANVPMSSAASGGEAMVTYRDPYGNVLTIPRSKFDSMPGGNAGRTIISETPGAQMGSPTATTPTKPLNGVNLSQTQQQWSGQASDANAICGPYLASLFASAVGRPPTAAEARKIAEDYGIYNSAGGGSGILDSAGFDEYATSMIRQLNPGSTATVQQTSYGVNDNAQIQAQAAEQLAGGSPIVGFNTAGHYFGADAFDTATGKFHVGGTGTSLDGGSDWMSVAEMEAAMGQVSDVITIVGAASTATGAQVAGVNTAIQGTATTAGAAGPGLFNTAAGLENLGVAASAGITQLTAVGVGMDSVVAGMDTGTVSVSQMTDAIIQQAANQGVATESAGRYAVGLTSQKDALLGVLQGFSATTPAAAALYEQLSTGAISTEEAAIGFAGLATSTAVGAGAIATSAGTVQTSIDLMATATSQTMTDLGTTMMTTMTDAAGTTVTTIADMAGNVTSQYATMANGATVNMDDMNVNATRSVDEMTGNITTAMSDMAGNVVTTVTTSQGQIISQIVTTNDQIVADQTATNTEMTTAQATQAQQEAAAQAEADRQELAAYAEQNTAVLGAYNAAAALLTDAQGVYADQTLANQDELGQNLLTAVDTLNTQMVTSYETGASDAAVAVGAGAEEIVGHIETITEAVDEVPGSVKGMADSWKNLPTPNVSGIVSAFKKIASAADDALSSVDKLADKTGVASGSGKSNPFAKKAAGGPVRAGVGYIVGEVGPELFVPLSDGTIIPNNQMRSMSGVNPHSPIGTTSDGISGSWGEYIVEDITRLTNDRADAVIESLTQVHESVQDVALGVTNGLDDVVSTISSAAGAVKSLLERIVTEVAKLPNLLTQINTSIGRIGTGTGTTPRPTPTPTPSPAPVIRPPQPGDPKRGINPPGGTRPTGPREGEPSPPRGVTPTPGVRPPRVPAPTDPTRGVTPNPNPGTRSSRSDNPFGEVIASATQMFREVATSTNNMRYVAGANVESMSQNVTTSADEMGNNVGSIFTGLETDTFDDFIQAAAAVDEAIRVMAENAGINVANMGTDISDVFWALGDDMAAALEAAELVAVPAADVLANAVVAKLGTMRAGTVQQINLLGSDMAVEFDRIAAASNGPSKNAYDLGEKITFSLGEAISDSSETNVVEPLVEAVLEAIDEAIDKAERKAGRSSRSAAFVLSGGGRSDGPGMAELIAEVQALKRSITQARSVSVNYTDSGPPASLMQDVAVLESLSRSGT